jgi:DNA-binding transcriptional ArsR family regulator
VRDEPVTIIDREVLKVLSTDTRMDIMKILAEGKRNPSFVAKKLKKSDATIVEHLKIMEKAGLVKKAVAPGKKWVFYSLTERGVGIVSSKSKHLVIILSTSLIGVVGGMAMLANHFYSGGTFAAAPVLQRGAEASDAALGAGEVAPAVGAALTQTPWIMYVGVVVLLVSIAGIGFYFYKKSKLNKGRIV